MDDKTIIPPLGPVATEPPEIQPWLAGDENDRMAREAARDVYRSVLSCFHQLANQSFEGKVRREFGVQHVGGRIAVTLEVKP